MRKIHDRITDLRGNLITVLAEGVALGEQFKAPLKRYVAILGSRWRSAHGQVIFPVFFNVYGAVRLDCVRYGRNGWGVSCLFACVQI